MQCITYPEGSSKRTERKDKEKMADRVERGIEVIFSVPVKLDKHFTLKIQR